MWLPREDWPTDSKRSKPLTTQQEAMVDLLNAALRLIADEHQLSPMAIASRKDLEKLVRGDADCALNTGWRNSVAGRRLAAVMQGAQTLVVEDGVPTLT